MLAMTNRANEDITPPHHVKLAWKLWRNQGEIQTKKLNTRKVVEGALELVSKEGLESLTIRRLSEQLGFTTMAVYRHISSREELLILMVDMGLGPPPDSIQKAPGWQQALRNWGVELFTCYQSYPWLLDIPVNGPPTTPNNILWLECVLQIMEVCKISLQQKLDAALLIDAHVRNIANLTRRDKLASTSKNITATSYSSWLRPLLDRKTFPHFSQVLEEGALEDESGPDLFFGLDLIINGLEANV